MASLSAQQLVAQALQNARQVKALVASNPLVPGVNTVAVVTQGGNVVPGGQAGGKPGA